VRIFSVYLMLVAVLATSAYSFGYYDSITKGTIIPGLTPSTTALGSIRSLGIPEAAGMFYNPAATAALPLSLQLSGSSIQWAERVIQSDIELMLRTYQANNNGTVAFVCPAGPFVVGGGIAKTGEFGYTGSHTVYDDPDKPKLGVAVLYAAGSQWETLGSISASINSKLSAGVSGGVRMAEADFSYEFNSHRFLVPDSSATWSVSGKEFAWHAGVVLDGEMFDSGISYSSKTEYMDDIVAIGASAFAPHLRDITVGFEARITSPLDHNRFLGDLFMKMPMNNTLNAMVSISFNDNRVASRAGFGFGIGFNFRLNRFDLGIGMLNRFRSRKNTAFPGEQSDRVDDSATMICLGVSTVFGN
jgi:hypothetical protein